MSMISKAKAKLIAQLTDDNCHTEARIEICKVYGFDCIKVMYQALLDKREKNGLEMSDVHTRFKIDEAMLTLIEVGYGTDEREIVYNLM